MTNFTRRETWTLNCLLALLLFLFCALVAVGQTPPTDAYPAEVVSITDADTLTVQLRIEVKHDLKLWYPVQSSHLINIGPLKLRASRYDAWESRRTRRSKSFLSSLSKLHPQTKTRAEAWIIEIAKGKLATAALARLLEAGQLYVRADADASRLYGRLPAAFVVVLPVGVDVDGFTGKVQVVEFMEANDHTRR